MPYDDAQALTRAEEFVSHALAIGAIELVPEGRKLKSGRVSPYFFNSGLFNTGESLMVLARSYAGAVAASGIGDYVLFGPPYKGIPLVAATAMELAAMGLPDGFAFSRKEAKDHGEGGLLVGAPLAGRPVIIVDDVITNGAAKREAVETIRAAGGTPVGLVIAFDRKERGEGELSAAQEFEAQFGVPVMRVATVDDLVSVLAKKGDSYPAWKAALPAVQAYRAQYGV